MNNVPLVDLNAQYEEIKDKMHNLWDEILGSMYLYLGPNVQKLEEEFADYNSSLHCIGVGSGTEAVHFSLIAPGIGSGDEVITVSYTFFASIEAIIHSGAHPVLLDINPETYTISPDAITEYIENNCMEKNGEMYDKRTGKTLKAIMPVHIYGQPADMDSINEIAEKYSLHVIEDACQAHGAEYKGKKAGNLGDIGAFSFYFSKNLGAFGEGGAVTTNNMEFSEKIKKLREHGQIDKYHHASIGFNSRLDELQAAVLRCKLELLDDWNGKRRKAAEYYTHKLQELPVETPVETEDVYHVYHLYVIRAKKRDELLAYLKDNGVGCGMHYPVPCHLQKPLKEYGYKEGDLPITEKASMEVLSLPMHPHITKADQNYVVEKIKEFYS